MKCQSTTALIASILCMLMVSSCQKEAMPIPDQVPVDNISPDAFDANDPIALTQFNSLIKSLPGAKIEVDLKTQADNYNLMGINNDLSFQYSQALLYYEKAVKIRQTLPDKAALGKTYNNIAVIHKLIELPNEAIAYYLDALKILKGTDNVGELAKVHYNLGRVYEQTKSFDQASECYKISLAYFKQLNDTVHVGQVIE